MALDFIRKNLFVLTARGQSFDIELQSVSGPSDSSDAVEIPHNNRVLKYPGIYHADDMTATFRAMGTAALNFFNQWRMDCQATSPGAAKSDVTVSSKDGLINFTLTGAFPQSMTRGDWDTSDGGPLTFEVTLAGDEVVSR